MSGTFDIKGQERMRVDFRRLVLAAPALVAAIYLALIAVYNLPGSIPRDRFRKDVVDALDPYFIQNWMLFSPNPPTTNLEGWYQIRYRDRTGKQHTLKPFSLTQAFDVKGQIPFVRARLGREVDVVGRSMVTITRQRLSARKDAAAQALDRASSVAKEDEDFVYRKVGGEETTNRVWSGDLEQIRYLVTLLADELAPPGGTTAVRAFFTSTPVRDPATEKTAPVYRVADSGWLPTFEKGRS
ncbi:DUF5819 family protein [Streptomyces achromogenes]|uniref:DUF5819 family protein n=1 Tax=Streptomyces achromogenes TaxID=67255 RepID=UPI0036FF68AF